MPRNDIEYWPLYSNINHKSMQAKDKWLNEKCEYTESMGILNKAYMQKKNKKINRTKDVFVNKLHTVEKGNSEQNGVREACNTQKRKRWKT